VDLFTTQALTALQDKIDAMGWYWGDLPLGGFKISKTKLPTLPIKPPSERASLSYPLSDVIAIQCRRESIIFSIFADRHIPIDYIFQEIHQKVPRLDLEKPFEDFAETLIDYKKDKKVSDGEMDMTEYNSSTYQFHDNFLKLFKVGGLSMRILSFNVDETEFKLEFTFCYVMDALKILDTDDSKLIMNKTQTEF
jgi:hypothetical protein